MTVKPQYLLTGVIKIIDSQFTAFGGEFHHRVRRVRRDNDQIGLTCEIVEGLSRSVSHRTGVKRGNLCRSLIGRREERCGKYAGDNVHQRCIYSFRIKPGTVISEILPHSCHHARPFAEQGHCIRDIGRHASPLFGHGIYEKGKTNGAQSFRENLLFEVTRKGHEVIVSNRASKKNIHVTSVIARTFSRSNLIFADSLRLPLKVRNDVVYSQEKAWRLSATPFSRKSLSCHNCIV